MKSSARLISLTIRRSQANYEPASRHSLRNQYRLSAILQWHDVRADSGNRAFMREKADCTAE